MRTSRQPGARAGEAVESDDSSSALSRFVCRQPLRVELLAVIVRLLQQELGGQLLPREPYATGEGLRFGNRTVRLLWSDGHVGVWMDRGVDSSLVEEIGHHLDGALASGELDDYFMARVD